MQHDHPVGGGPPYERDQPVNQNAGQRLAPGMGRRRCGLGRAAGWSLYEVLAGFPSSAARRCTKPAKPLLGNCQGPRPVS